jgi:hypothetical protein
MYAHAGYKKQGGPDTDEVHTQLQTLCEEIDNDAFWTNAQ